MAIAMLKPLLEYTWILKIQDFLALTLIFSVLSFILYIDPSEVEFVHAVTAGGSVKFLPTGKFFPETTRFTT